MSNPYASQIPGTPTDFYAVADRNAPLRGASIVDATKRYFTKTIQFSGRASRSEFWWAYLVVNVAYFIASFSVVLSVVVLPLFIPMIALTARRLHDIGKSGWLQLIFYISYIPMVGTIIFVAIAVMKASDAGITLKQLEEADIDEPAWNLLWEVTSTDVLIALAFLFVAVVIGLVTFVIWLIWMIAEPKPAGDRFGPHGFTYLQGFPPAQSAAPVPHAPSMVVEPVEPHDPRWPQYPDGSHSAGSHSAGSEGTGSPSEPEGGSTQQ
jgi:hypothetical protein